MKTTILLSLTAALSPMAFADTITWTGGGDGVSWTDTSNWQVESTEQPPAVVPFSTPSSGDNVIISGDGVTVEYNGGDPYINATESLTISGGARLVQTVASWWHGENGTVTIDGGIFDTGSCSGTHAWSSISVVNGGKLLARTAIPAANLSIDATSTYEMFSNNHYSHTGNEIFTAFTATSQNAELTATADTAVFDEDIVWTCKLISATAVSIQWRKGSLVTWDTDWGGYYNAGGSIDIAEGWTGSFTFAYPPATVFDSCFRGKISYAGSTLTAETFDLLFDVEATTVTDPSGNEHPASRVSIAAPTEWKIGTVSAAGITSSSATISATLSEINPEAAFSVRYAYSASPVSEEDALNGDIAAESEGTYSASLTALEDLTEYHYAFAIVTNGAVAAFKAGSFLASDYEYVYNNSWLGGLSPANLPASIASVLFLSDFSTSGELRLDNKRVVESVLTAGTMLYGTLTVENSAVVNTRNNAMEQAPFGFYGDLGRPLDFHSGSGSGTMKRACSYTMRCADTQLDRIYTELFASGKIRMDGATVSQSAFESMFTVETADETETGSYDFGDGEGTVEAELLVTTITMWDTLPTAASGNWIFKNGSRVKLAGNTRIADLVLETSNVRINTTGSRLKVASMTVGGTRLYGTLTADNCPFVIGDGSVQVAEAATIIAFK